MHEWNDVSFCDHMHCKQYQTAVQNRCQVHELLQRVRTEYPKLIEKPEDAKVDVIVKEEQVAIIPGGLF